MTDRNPNYWARAVGAYLQPTVVEPPEFQNVNNARHVIWHFGRMVDIEVYPTAETWRANDNDAIDDGRNDRGEPRIVRIRALCQPMRSNSGFGQPGGGAQLITPSFGERTEGLYVIHVDSHDPLNIIAAQENADIFPNGIRIIGPDDEAPYDRYNFATVIRFNSKRWKVMSLMDIFGGGDEEVTPDGAVYRVIAAEFKDRAHERDATNDIAVDNEDQFWGPQI